MGASPLALGIVAFAVLSLPPALQKASSLVPALQSDWLVMHVSVVMLSYATLLFGSVLCMAALLLSLPEDSPITVLRNGATPAFRAIADSLAPKGEPAVVAAGVGSGVGGGPSIAADPPPIEPNTVMAMSATVESKNLTMPMSGTAEGAGGGITVEFSGGAFARQELSEHRKLSLTIDDLAYRSILLGWGFLTIGIISGAVWANEAWGSYWSWDPKETWALICWLVYAIYFHVRFQLGWDARDSAKIGAFGFFVVWLCYIGVNLLGVGLHSYGFFLK